MESLIVRMACASNRRKERLIESISMFLATYSNSFAEYLIQIIGPNGAVAILSLLWVDSTVSVNSIESIKKNTLIRESSALQLHASCPLR